MPDKKAPPGAMASQLTGVFPGLPPVTATKRDAVVPLLGRSEGL